MDDLTYSIAVLVVLIGGLVGVAHWLDRRRKAAGSLGPALPPLGPVGRVLLWLIWALVAGMVLALISAFVLGMPPLIWVSVGCLVLYLIVMWLFQVVRLAGK
jgi:hypothetical protein